MNTGIIMMYADSEDAMDATPLPTNVAVNLNLAEALRQAEASTRAEGVEPNDNPVYLDIKRRLLAGEITLDEADANLSAAFTQSASL
jgi:hypothetical protein